MNAEPVSDRYLLGLAWTLRNMEAERARATAPRYSPEVCIDAVKWQQKPLDCQGIEMGGKGKIEIDECEIAGGDGDIREFTCRRA
jgi:hypothetical protein